MFLIYIAYAALVFCVVKLLIAGLWGTALLFVFAGVMGGVGGWYQSKKEEQE